MPSIPNSKPAWPADRLNILAVVGPTASGKSELAVELAKKYNGEIISCDSRQIYKGLNIGSGKVAGTWSKSKPARLAGGSAIRNPQFVYKSIPHYCIDTIDPKKQYSVALFQKAAQKTMEDIFKRGKLPILCGGTGFWVDAVINNEKLPEVKPNLKLRKELEKLSVEELFEKLKLLDPDRAAVIDFHNPHRLIRALEIVITTGAPVPKLNIQSASQQTPFNILYLGIYPGQDTLYAKIDKRLKERLKKGMIKEVERLHAQGLSWKRLESFGLEYNFISLFLQKKITRTEMEEQLSFAIKHYAKRQMTWFRKNESICWIENPKQANALVKEFLS